MWFDNMRRNGGKKSYAAFSTAGLLESLINTSESPWDDYGTQHFLNLLNTAFFLLRKKMLTFCRLPFFSVEHSLNELINLSSFSEVKLSECVAGGKTWALCPRCSHPHTLPCKTVLQVSKTRLPYQMCYSVFHKQDS